MRRTCCHRTVFYTHNRAPDEDPTGLSCTRSTPILPSSSLCPPLYQRTIHDTSSCTDRSRCKIYKSLIYILLNMSYNFTLIYATDWSVPKPCKDEIHVYLPRANFGLFIFLIIWCCLDNKDNKHEEPNQNLRFQFERILARVTCNLLFTVFHSFSIWNTSCNNLVVVR